MQLIYNIFIEFFWLLVRLFSLWQPKTKQFVLGRNNWRQKLKNQTQSQNNWIWFHCASLGEFEQARPLIEAVKKQNQKHPIALSFFSPSGYHYCKDHAQADLVFYLPIDTKQNAKDLLDILQPKMLILVKYEFWFNLMKMCQNKKLPMFSVSSIFRQNQLFFMPILGSWFAKRLQLVEHFFVQNQESKKLLANLGIQQVTISGDTRFDRVKNILEQDIFLPKIKQFKGSSKLLVVGSSWPADEAYLFDYFDSNQKVKDIKILIAPHNVNSKTIEGIEEKSTLSTVRFSDFDVESNPNKQVMILDTIGLLSKVYYYANWVYIGGGFNKSGIHNVLEAAVFGVPIVVGQHYKKFKEARDLKRVGALYSFTNKQELKEYLDALFWNDQKTKTTGQLAKDYVAQAPLATQTILKHLTQYLDSCK